MHLTSSASSAALVARSQAPPLSSNSPASLEVPRIRVPADHLQTHGAAAGVPVGTAPGAGAGPVLAKSAPLSSRKHDTSRSDWLSYGERAPWSGGSRTPSLSADTDAKVHIKTQGGTADKAFVASVSSPLPPPLSLPTPPPPCLVPKDSRGPSSSHVGGAGGVSIVADDGADSLLARLAGKAKQAAAAALSASAAGAAGAAEAGGAAEELPPLMSLESTFMARSKTGSAAVRRATPSAGSFGESGVPADGGVGGVTVVSARTGGGGGGRDESTAAGGGSAFGGAGAGAGTGAGAGARLSELCKEDKAKVARLMQASDS